MLQAFKRLRPRPGWGAAASVAAHLLVLALLVFGLPLPEFEPPEPEPEPETIAVEIVPPPEQAEQEPAGQQAEGEEEEEQAAEEAPAPPPEAAAGEGGQSAPPIQVLRPVFEFGEQDAGPRQAADGSAAREAEAPSDTLPPEPEEPEAGEAEPLPEQPVELTEARTLYSERATGGALATIAIDGLPRGVRGSELCTSELREQLRHAEAPVWPDLLPAYRLGAGTVIEVRDAAFRAGGQWYGLAYRCEVDPDVTRVLSFAFRVGAPIPRDQWKSRGFPDS